MSATGGIESLQARIRHDLEILDYPNSEWLSPFRRPSGRQVYDVAIVGAGQAGLAIAFALRREKIDNIVVLDRQPIGREGPWLTYARMDTLRTPKYLIGPDLGIPSLTFRAWFEAQPRLGRWDSLVRIPRTLWVDYLNWYRNVLAIPVTNDAEVIGVEPDFSGNLVIDVHRASGRERVFARKVVFANGMDGAGEWIVPPEIAAAVPPGAFAHTADPISFDRLKGKSVGVLGIGASAVDNAAVALEAGAAHVDIFCRRSALPGLEARGWIENNGFLRHFFELDDARRWRIMRRFWDAGAPAPPWSMALATSYPNCRVHLGAPWTKIEWNGQSVQVETPAGSFRFDFLIVATGLVVDLRRRPEFARIVAQIATWGDRYAPPPGEESPALALCPYLGPNYEFREKKSGAAPYLKDIHLFNWGATPSNGISASSITGMKFGVPRLVAGLTRDLYFSIADAHAAAFPAPDIAVN